MLNITINGNDNVSGYGITNTDNCVKEGGGEVGLCLTIIDENKSIDNHNNTPPPLSPTTSSSTSSSSSSSTKPSPLKNNNNNNNKYYRLINDTTTFFRSCRIFSFLGVIVPINIFTFLYSVSLDHGSLFHQIGNHIHYNNPSNETDSLSLSTSSSSLIDSSSLPSIDIKWIKILELLELPVLCLLLSYFGHCIAYFTNSYIDYFSGVDRPETSYDRTLFDRISIQTLVRYIRVSFGLVILVGLVILYECSRLDRLWLMPFVFGYTLILLIGSLYTHLKYVAMGHIAYALYIFATTTMYSMLYTNQMPNQTSILYFVVIVLLYQLSIIGNYHRDLKEDSQAGILTISILLGEKYSLYLLISICLISHMFIVFLSIFTGNLWLLLSLFTLPLFSFFLAQAWRGNHYWLNYKLGIASALTIILFGLAIVFQLL
ncbi:hypothetical protein DFA_07339 [Cavenderia fasciculata]|uniref:UbiA prenyltransferase family protein n=1 Tax=Cavenderia fasciculata TaxID=261658 RepID=F4PW54_CACFS|nr:uncharacterized protein DFA_07339 [Cavenderia fasciculata]EGG20218.1 hypothetical protein DFA_07339 [Cavenderia fasciculata]|eukprot:XP_004367201.1 hypothetical protein DFA_07339 [Cavenderia fasciculata]